MPDNVLQIGQALGLFIALVFGTFVGVGLSTATFILFVRGVINSPALVRFMEGIVNSFPPETRELLNVLAQLILKLSDNTPEQELIKAMMEKMGETVVVQTELLSNLASDGTQKSQAEHG